MGFFDNRPKSGSNDVEQQVSKLAQTVQQMQGQIGEIVNAVKTIHSTQTEMQESFKSMSQDFQPRGHQYQDMDKQDLQRMRNLSEYSDEELHMLSEQQKYDILQQNIVKQMEQTIQKALGPLSESVQGTQRTVAQTRAEAELQAIVGEKGADGSLIRPDFNEILPMMVKLKKDSAYANLPMRDLYELGKSRYKSENPEGFKSLQAKYFPDRNRVQRPYGGLLSDTLQETGIPGDMSIEDAAQDTLREFLETGGGLPDADTSDLM